MRRHYTVLSGIFGCVCLTSTACSSGGEESRTEGSTTRVSSSSAGTTEAAAAGTLPFQLGEWDRQAADFWLFDPCTEIPSEAFEAAELAPLESPIGSVEVQDISCASQSRDSFDPFIAQEVYAHSTLPEEMAIVGFTLSPYTDPRLPGTVFMLHPESPFPECISSMHTNRGQWGVSYMDSSFERNSDPLCQVAADKHYKLFTAIGG